MQKSLSPHSTSQSLLEGEFSGYISVTNGDLATVGLYDKSCISHCYVWKSWVLHYNIMVTDKVSYNTHFHVIIIL